MPLTPTEAAEALRVAQGLPRSDAPPWMPAVSGPYLTVAAVAALALLDRMVPGMPDTSALVLMALVYAAFAGGLRAGVVSAAIAVAFFAGQRALPGAAFTLDPAQVPGFLVLCVTAVAMVLLVAHLKARAERSYELHAERERLRELDQLKTQFLNNAAHELRTPLMPILVQLRLLRGTPGQPSLSEKQLRSVEMMDRNIRRLNVLVQDLLEVARMQAGKLRLERDLVALRAVVGEAVESFHDVAFAGDVALEARLADEGLVAHVDPKRLIQVMFNLLDNALRFTQPQGTITVVLERRGNQARIEVRDTGAGMDPQRIGSLFQPFVQIHDADRQGRTGTGLGLYICKGIVEEHGGTIRAHSDGPGTGSTFVVELPLAAAPLPHVHVGTGAKR